MDGMTLNKIIGAFLAVILVIMGLSELSHALFSSGDAGHDDHHGEELSINEKMAASFAYFVPIADTSGPAPVEEVFDLGLALASADASRGASSFQQKCAACHTVQQGGANGTGPNLWGVIGAQKAAHDGFRYSNALSGMEGAWSYANMNDWLKNPKGYVSGTSMSFAGLNRDEERANVIAYLATLSSSPQPFPAPLVTEAATEAVIEPAVETAVETAPATETETVEADAGVPATETPADEQVPAIETGNGG